MREIFIHLILLIFVLCRHLPRMLWASYLVLLKVWYISSFTRDTHRIHHDSWLHLCYFNSSKFLPYLWPTCTVPNTTLDPSDMDMTLVYGMFYMIDKATWWILCYREINATSLHTLRFLCQISYKYFSQWRRKAKYIIFNSRFWIFFF